jgi:hypothetical protein
MNKNTFYNTVHLSGNDLKIAIKNATSQENAVYLIFLTTGKKYTASDITNITENAGIKWPIWSNRRAITNLMNNGKLSKLPELKRGPMGKPEHYYQVLIKTDNELQDFLKKFQSEEPEPIKPDPSLIQTKLHF